MTPEEKRVVQTAIYLRYCLQAGTAGDPPRLGKLLDAVDALIYSCSECNAGGHTCPGDGNPIAHGDYSCGEHDEDKPRWQQLIEPVPREHEEEPISTPDVPEWVETTWMFVENDDRVRLNGQEADVKKITKNDFHAQVDTWVDRTTGRERDSVKGRWDHVEVTVELAHLPGRHLPFPPNSSIEVLMNRERKAVHLLATELGGKKL